MQTRRSIGHECLMNAQRTYMLVDPRRDHSFRAPRPDLTVEYGTPNACDDCHADRTARWAADQVAAWDPEKHSKEERAGHFARAAC